MTTPAAIANDDIRRRLGPGHGGPPGWMTDRHVALPAAAVSLTVFRAVGADGVYDTGVTFASWDACNAFALRMRRAGWIADSADTDSYAVLDVRDHDGDILCDFAIPDAAAHAALIAELRDATPGS